MRAAQSPTLGRPDRLRRQGPRDHRFPDLRGASLLWLFTLVTAQEDNPDGLHVADRSLSPVFNGFAMAGEQISVVILLAIPGAIALFGYDGFTAAIDGLLTLGVMLLLAQRIRDSRRYTLGTSSPCARPGRSPAPWQPS